MASNAPLRGWKVKMVDIPPSITYSQLTQTIGLPKTPIFIRKVKKNDTHYAWINDFSSEEEAEKFAQEWSNSSAFSGILVKCIVSAPKTQEAETHYSAQQPIVSNDDENRNESALTPLHGDKHRAQRAPKSNPASGQPQTPGKLLYSNK